VDNPKLKRLFVGDFSIRRVIRSGVLITLLVYVGVFVYVSVFGNAIIFQPPRPSYRDTEELIKLTSDGVQISALHLKNPNATYTILYSHGNAEDIGAIRPVLEDLRTMGFSVLAYDYRGYGTSAGASSEESTYRDIESAFDYLTRDQKIPPTQIIALGRSLGGAVAIDLAYRRSLAGVIAESSFVSAYRVLTRFPIYPFDRFKSISKIREVHCPVLVIHGRNDEVISFWHGEKLFQAANEPKLFYWVDGAGHNDLFEVAGIGYGQALKSFVSLIERRDANR
jgi:abhydrolase domain-containing protein 17